MNARTVCGRRHLRELAAHCRYLAAGAYSDQVAAELRTLAEDFEREAERLGRRSATRGVRVKAAVS